MNRALILILGVLLVLSFFHNMALNKENILLKTTMTVCGDELTQANDSIIKLDKSLQDIFSSGLKIAELNKYFSAGELVQENDCKS